MPSPRELAVHLLARIELEGAYADRILSTPRVMGLDPRDRAFARELVLGVLRWKLRLDHIIDSYYTMKAGKSLDPGVRTVLRLGLFQMMFMDSVPDRAAVYESVELGSRLYGKHIGGLVNAVLRTFTRRGEPDNPQHDRALRLSVEKSCPVWLVRRWIDRFGEETAEAVMDAANRKHPVSIRVNSLKTDIPGLINELKKSGFTAEPAGLPGYCTVEKGDGLFEKDAFRNGLFTVQDPAAALASELMGPQPGERVLDLCAAPGGKTTHLAELMGDTGTVDAVDINPNRLGLVEQAARRIGLHSIRCMESDATVFRSMTGTPYDRVLIDAPCTGTAVFSKRPEMKWRRSEADILRMAELQGRIIGNAASLVRPGGVLVYSTCSLEPEENENVVERFMSMHAFEYMRDDRYRAYEHDCGYLILPHHMDGSGAFAVKLRRNEP